jgi:hypothetical protein
MTEPSKTISSQISLAIDIKHLLATPIITTETQNIVTAAACNNPNLLEPDDFTLTSCPSAPQTTPSQTSQATFNTYRLQVVTGLVRAKASPIISQWPKLQLTTLAQLVNNDAKGVVQLSEMLDQLIPAMATQKQLNEAGLLVFAKTWLILYAFGAAHKAWVASGHAPILPDNQIDDFVQASLERLTSGKIGIGLISMETEKIAVAQYEFNSNLILYPNQLFRAPLLESIYYTPFSILIPHEFWHSHQDEMKSRNTFGQGEVDAEILGLQAHALKNGSASTRTAITNFLEKNAQTNSATFQQSLQQATPKKLIAEVMLNPESELHKAYYSLRFKLLDAAEKEMLEGGINQKRRAQLAHDYTTYRSIQLMDELMEDYYQWHVTSQANKSPMMEVTREAIATSVQQAPSYKYLTNKDLIDFDALVDIHFELYNGLREFFILYDPQNETPAREYLQNTFIPKLLGPITDTYMKLIIPMDGIPE